MLTESGRNIKSWPGICSPSPPKPAPKRDFPAVYRQAVNNLYEVRIFFWRNFHLVFFRCGYFYAAGDFITVGYFYFIHCGIFSLQDFSYCKDFLTPGIFSLRVFLISGSFFHCGRTLDKPQFYIGPFILRKLQNSKPTVRNSLNSTVVFIFDNYVFQ